MNDRIISVVVFIVVFIFISLTSRTSYSITKHDNFGFELLYYDVSLGENIQTTNGTVAPISQGNDVTGTAGMSISGNILNMRLFIGLNIRAHLLGLTANSDRVGNYNIKSADHNAFRVFTQLVPGLFSIVPRIELGIPIHNNIIAGLEVGFPFSEFNVVSGYDFRGEWETVQKDSWHGFGHRIALNLSFDKAKYPADHSISRFADIRISFFIERYFPEFDGEKANINTSAFGFSWIAAF